MPFAHGPRWSRSNSKQIHLCVRPNQVDRQFTQTLEVIYKGGSLHGKTADSTSFACWNQSLRPSPNSNPLRWDCLR